MLMGNALTGPLNQEDQEPYVRFFSNLIWEGPEGSRCSAGMFHIS